MSDQQIEKSFAPLLFMPVASFVSSVLSYYWLYTTPIKVPHLQKIKIVQFVNMISQSCVFGAVITELQDNQYLNKSFTFGALSGFLFNIMSINLINFLVLEKFSVLDPKINVKLIHQVRICWIAFFVIIYPVFLVSYVLGMGMLKDGLPYITEPVNQIWLVGFIASWPILVSGVVYDNWQSIYLVSLVYRWRRKNAKNGKNNLKSVNEKNYTTILWWISWSLVCDWIGIFGAALEFFDKAQNSLLIYHPVLGIHSSIMVMVMIYMTKLTFEGQTPNLIKFGSPKQLTQSNKVTAK